MQFEMIASLANATPISVLSAAWGVDRSAVMSRKKAETPLTISEAGSLAELHGMRLEDILPV